MCMVYMIYPEITASILLNDDINLIISDFVNDLIYNSCIYCNNQRTNIDIDNISFCQKCKILYHNKTPLYD